MTLLQWKLSMLAVTWLTGWVSGALPLGGRRAGLRRGWIGGGNAFAAGLFLAIGLLHLLPESAEGFRSRAIDWPAASMLAVAAFLLMLLLEHVLLPEAGHQAAHTHSGQGLSEHGNDHHHPAAGHRHGPVDATARPFVLVLALSVHSVLAGLALGTQLDLLAAGMTFVAITVHKATAGLALGVTLASSPLAVATSRRLVAGFAAMTPLGIAVGLVATRWADLGLFEPAATALAGGTFLYIGAFDLSQDELLGPGRRWSHWLAAAAGAGLAALLSLAH